MKAKLSDMVLIKPNAESVARVFRCTVAQAKAQYAKNAKQLRELAANPPAGFTPEALLEHAQKFEAAALMQISQYENLRN